MFEDHYEGTKSLPIKPVVKELIDYGRENQKKWV